MFSGNISMKFYDMSHFVQSNGREKKLSKEHIVHWRRCLPCQAPAAKHLCQVLVREFFALCSKILFNFLKFPTSRTMKATTDAWIALEDEEDEEEEGGDDDAMRALFEEEQDEEEADVESDGEDLDEIFELF